MSRANIALVGLGTVGTGVVSILERQREALALRAGAELVLKHVVVRDTAKPREVTLPPQTLTDDPRRALDDPDVSVVVELMGGIDTAGEIVRAALRAGKSVVTANKALLAESGRELFELATASGASLAFDAAVAGGIPIVTNLCQCLAANRIDSINGILNGTCNYILSQMEQEGRSYEMALREAQAHGYAEADPTMDVDGTDTTQKLAILAQLAMQVDVDWREIPRMGIERLEAIDVQAAEELGYAIRLVASAERGDNLKDVSLQVDPVLIPPDHGLAGIDGPDNAILVKGNAVGDMLYRGAGAGRMPTASAVVADLVDTVSGRAVLTFRGLSQFELSGKMTDDDTRAARFYVRLPGVCGSPLEGEVAQVMIEHDVSIASSLQYDVSDNHGPTPQVVILTQRSKPATIASLVAELQSLNSVTAPVVLARVAD